MQVTEEKMFDAVLFYTGLSFIQRRVWTASLLISDFDSVLSLLSAILDYIVCVDFNGNHVHFIGVINV